MKPSRGHGWGGHLEVRREWQEMDEKVPREEPKGGTEAQWPWPVLPQIPPQALSD